MNKFKLISWWPWLSKQAYNYIYRRNARQQAAENRQELARLSDLKGIHQGKRCFIIGTGPSLKISDLEALQGEITFAPNRIYELLANTQWRPTYYMCQDHTIIRSFADRIKGVECDMMFLPVDYIDLFKGPNTRFFVLKEQIYYPGRAPFSRDIPRYIGQGYTVTYGAIQMAAYMGFKEIYLIGVDHNYNITRDAKGRPVKSAEALKDYAECMADYVNLNNLPRIEESTLAYETAEKLSRKLGIKIYNATRGGKLEAFERVDLDTLLANINETKKQS